MNRVVSSLIGAILVAVFFLRPGVDCTNSLLSTAQREFIHIEPYHLVLNLYALYRISHLEGVVGSPKFAVVTALMVVASTVATHLLTKVLPIKCSIGFSGVLLGLMAYAFVTQSEKMTLLPVVYLALSSVGGPNVSVSGHLIGIVCGTLIGVASRLVVSS